MKAPMFAKLRTLLMIPDSEPVDHPFAASDIAMLQTLRPSAGRVAIDDASWKDLLLDAFSRRLSGGVSIFGQQVLHQRLREGQDDAACADQAARVCALAADPARMDALQRSLACLRHADHEAAAPLFQESAPAVPWWVGKAWLLPLLLLVSIAAVVASPLAWLGTGVALYLLMANQMRYYRRVEEWARKLNAIQMLLRATTLLGGADAAAAGKLNRALSRSPVLAMTPGAKGYADWFALANVEHYFKSARLVDQQRAFLQDCFVRVAGVEADLALARHVRAAPRLCWAVRDGERVELAAMVHPLLDEAQPLDFRLGDKGAFISGQNGIGKSTLLRTAGLNLVLARAFGFCHAASALAPDLPVYTSMQSEDSLFGGESLYQSELRRAQELLAAGRAILIIDEIFRGTNHLESVSAAAAVLDRLAQQGRVIVSSHNLVLGPLLAHRLDAQCVSKLDGALRLAPGLLAHTNGIALLAERGFGPAIEANAAKVFDWLNSYLAHPGSCAELLAA